MSWVPRMGKCTICGEPIMMNSSVQKYCPECGKLMRKVRYQENRGKEIARHVARKRGIDPDRYKGKEHECQVKETCTHGSHDCCMYLVDTGRLRTTDGYPIRGGRCDAYKKKKKNRKKTIRTPEAAVSARKANEV